MGLNQNSFREGQTSGAFWGLLYAYDLIGEFLKWLAQMRGEVWRNHVTFPSVHQVNPHARGSLGYRFGFVQASRG